MFNLFYLHTTQMEFLEVLINNRDRDFADTMDAIHQKFPRMTQYEIDSYLDELRKNGYIEALDGDDGICDFLVQPTAMAHMRENYELRENDRMWDVVKIIVGFILGYLTRYLQTM